MGNPGVLLGFKSNMGQRDGEDWTGEPGAVLLAPAEILACPAKGLGRAGGAWAPV